MVSIGGFYSGFQATSKCFAKKMSDFLMAIVFEKQAVRTLVTRWLTDSFVLDGLRARWLIKKISRAFTSLAIKIQRLVSPSLWLLLFGLSGFACVLSS